MKRDDNVHWSDRVAIALMIGIWLTMGILGTVMHGGGYVAFLLG